MKKTILILGLGVVLAAVADVVSLTWKFFGYAENSAVAQAGLNEAVSVDASVSAADEAELDVDSFPSGSVFIIR